MLKEFKEFISRGNVIDLAVGVIIGGAFTAIVNSFVNDIFMPLISLITGGLDFNAWNIALGSGEKPPMLNLGSLASAVINFLLVAVVLFFIIKAINALRKKKDKPEKQAPATTKICPYCKSEISIEATRCPHCTSILQEK